MKQARSILALVLALTILVGTVPVNALANGETEPSVQGTETLTLPEETVAETVPVTEAPTEPETVPATEAPTEPETVPATEVPTEPETVPATEAPTEPEIMPQEGVVEDGETVAPVLEDAATETVEITLGVGETLTFVDYTQCETSGTHDAAATISWVGENTTKNILLTKLVSGGQYYIEAAHASENTDTIITDQKHTTETEMLLLSGTMSSLPEADGLWTITAVEGVENGYYIMQDNQYLTMGSNTAGVTETATVIIIKESACSPCSSSHTVFYVQDNADENASHVYMNQHGGRANNRAAGYYTNHHTDGGNYWNFYLNNSGRTTVTITGKSIGTMDVTIGNVTYQVSVVMTVDTAALEAKIAEAEALIKDVYTADTWTALQTALTDAKTALAACADPFTDATAYNTAQTAVTEALSGLTSAIDNLAMNAVEKTVTLYPGQTKTYYAYADTFTTEPDSATASGTINGTTLSFTGEALGETQATVAHITYQLRVVRQVRELYIAMGSYVSMAVSGDPDTSELDSMVATVAVADGTATITPVAVGDTTVIIGDVEYHLHVEAEQKKETITLYVGRTATIVDNTGDYVTNASYNLENKDENIATLALTSDSAQHLVAEEEPVPGEWYNVLCYNDSWYLGGAVNGTGLWIYDPDTYAFAPAEYWKLTDTQTADTYMLESINGGYLTVGNGTSDLMEEAHELKVTAAQDGYCYIKDGDYYLNQYGGSGNTSAKGYTGGDRGSYWSFCQLRYGQTILSVTGVKAGSYTVTVGNTEYTIIVKAYDSTNTKNTPYLSAQSGTQAEGKPLTKLTIGEGMSYSFTLELSDFANTAVTLKDKAGLTIGESDGTYTITAPAVDENKDYTVIFTIGGVDYQLPVTVLNTDYTEGTSANLFDIYIQEVVYSDVYYVWDAGTEWADFIPAYEGEQIYAYIPNASGHSLNFFGKASNGYALAFMSSTNSNGEYQSLYTSDGTPLTTGFYERGTWNSLVSIFNSTSGVSDTDTAVYQMTATALEKDLEGVCGFTRAAGNSGDVTSTMSFKSQKLPTVKKTVVGILGSNMLASSFEYLTEDTVAEAGEYIFYAITVTKYEEEVDIAYSDVYLTDTKEGAYFITATGRDETTGTGSFKADTNVSTAAVTLTDENGNTKSVTGTTWAATNPMTGESETRGNQKNITAYLNPEGTGEESYTFYVAYPITANDIETASTVADDDTEDNKTMITNDVGLSYQYKALYAGGTSTASGTSTAKVELIGKPLDDLVIDFAMKVEYEVDADAYLNTDVDLSKAAQKACLYGKLEITVQTDAEGKNTGILAYTPDKIMEGRDLVYLLDSNGEYVNHYYIYPATTMYYDESFLTYDDNWTWTGPENHTKDTVKNTLQQTHIMADETPPEDGYFNFGYDSVMAEESGSYYSTKELGATASFTFVGTGFELYANCAENSGWVAVRVVNNQNQFVRMYIVNTQTGAGTSDATNKQAGAKEGLPIVAVRDLDHGQYTVTLVKLLNDERAVNIDGIRILNTMKDSTVFTSELEDAPVFYELRDAVLQALNISGSETYGTLDEMRDQIYNALGTDSAVVIDASVTESGGAVVTTGETAQDLLDNGPKNELYLWQNQTLVFKVETNRALQIGLKAPMGEVKYTIDVSYVEEDSTEVITMAQKDGTISTPVDMYYTVVDPTGSKAAPGKSRTYTITVTNTGENILSVTTLKICDDPNFAMATLTETDIENVLVSMGYTDAPDAPVVKATNIASSGKIKISWNKVEGAARYEVYRSTSKNSGYSRLITTAGTYVNNTSAEVGKTYYYYVIAVDADGNQSEKSNIAYRCCDLAQPKIKLTNVASSGKIKISWEKVEGATKYEVYRSTDGKNFTYLTSTKNLYVTNTSAVAGKTYYYKVRAICGVSSAASAYSAAGYRCCDLKAPVITVTRNTKGKPVIKWDAIDGAIKYKVYIYQDGKLVKTAYTTGKSLTHSSAVKGTTYVYRVQAIHKNSSANSAKSASVKITSK